MSITAKKWGIENGWEKEDLDEAYEFIGTNCDLPEVSARTKLNDDLLEKLEEALEASDAAEDSADETEEVEETSEVLVEEGEEPELDAEEAARLRRLRRAGVKTPNVIAADPDMDKRDIKVRSNRKELPELTIHASSNGEAVRQYILMLGIPHSKVHEHTFRCE